jgi:ABC-type iron transport system FetAB permease component
MPAPVWRKRVTYLAAEPGWWSRPCKSTLVAGTTRYRWWSDWDYLTPADLGRSKDFRRGRDKGWGLCGAHAPIAGALAGRATLRTRLGISRGRRILDCRTHFARNERALEHSRQCSGEPCRVEDLCDEDRRRVRGKSTVTYIQLTYGDLILPALPVVMDGALSLVLRLKLERQLAVATVRMVLQLVLVGCVLTFLFAAVSPLWTALAALIMVLFASREIGRAAEASPSGHLELRAGRRMHAARLVRDAIRSGLMPTINAMAAMGVVCLPGMMTGQIPGGVEPTDAVKYQLLIMFLIAGGTGLGTLAAVMGGARLITDHRHRLRLDRFYRSRNAAL